uniref:F-box domain-containing protein n=1 Tax=Chrysotila carterae TaxID=13221 RepID=A0A7S4B2F4_CHRCT
MDEASERVDISSLPYVLCVQILAELRSMRDTMRCRRLSRRWKELASDEALWQQLCARHFALTERVAPSFGPVRNEPERLISQRVVIEGVAGAPELIGRGVGIVRGVDGDKCLVHFLDAAGDVWVDVSRLAPADELAAAAVTDMEPCASYVEAAYKWSRLRQALGLETAAAHHLAPHWSQASLAWRQLEAWAFKVSPDLRASFNGAAKPGAWRHFVEELQLSPSDESQLLGLQLLSAIHNGQHFSSDMELALSNGVIEQASGDDTEPVPHTVRTQQATLGLIGGYAAYSELASTRLYPLELVAGWTRFFRDQLPHTHGYIVAAASFNLRKFFCVDLLTGELRVGPVAMARRGRPSLPETTLAAVPRESAQQHETTPALRCQLVKWLWQLSDRLTNGMYSFEKLIPMQPASIGVSLFPRTCGRGRACAARRRMRHAPIHRRCAAATLCEMLRSGHCPCPPPSLQLHAVAVLSWSDSIGSHC